MRSIRHSAQDAAVVQTEVLVSHRYALIETRRANLRKCPTTINSVVAPSGCRSRIVVIFGFEAADRKIGVKLQDQLLRQLFCSTIVRTVC